MEWIQKEAWSPYVVGAAIGVLSWLTFLLSDKALGCSTAFSRTAGMIERLFRGDKTMNKPYYQKYPPYIDWQWMLVLGIVAGAFLSSKLSGQFQWQWVPDFWAYRFGSNPIPRFGTAFIGGILMGIGSRWANGCTSGHGISGTLQLTVSSWMAVLCFFAGGIVVAFILY